MSPDFSSAACATLADHEKDMFTADDPTDSERLTMRLICNQCLVKETCLEWALTRGETGGWWGGQGQYELGQLRGKRRRSRAKR